MSNLIMYTEDDDKYIYKLNNGDIIHLYKDCYESLPCQHHINLNNKKFLPNKYKDDIENTLTSKKEIYKFLLKNNIQIPEHFND